jgi:hypothetical protein
MVESASILRGKEINGMMDNLSQGVHQVVATEYELKNENKLCDPACGVMWQAESAASGHIILEDFLKSIEETIETN